MRDSWQWDLVCDLRSLIQMGQTIYMGGVLVGAVVFGSLSDRYNFFFSPFFLLSQPRKASVCGSTVSAPHLLSPPLSSRYGRRYLLILSYLIMAVSGTCAALSTSFPLFCVCRFGCGMALSGIALNSFSLSETWTCFVRD